jgi:hypothetical protein
MSRPGFVQMHSVRLLVHTSPQQGSRVCACLLVYPAAVHGYLALTVQLTSQAVSAVVVVLLLLLLPLHAVACQVPIVNCVRVDPMGGSRRIRILRCFEENKLHALDPFVSDRRKMQCAALLSGTSLDAAYSNHVPRT